MSKILKNIPFKINLEKLKKKLKINNQDNKRFVELTVEAKKIASPRAVYRESYITEKADDYVVIDEYKLKSKILRKNIGSHDRVYLYVITVGNELADWAAGINDVLESYWAEQIQEAVLASAVNFVYEKLDKFLGTTLTSEMNPGSLRDWPINEQQKLFSLLGNPEETIGLKLTKSFLMLPAKSVSGIKFINKDDFTNCQLCQRENCPNRRASFEPEKLAEIQ